MRVRYIKRVSYVISGWIGVSIPAMRVRYIAKVTSNSKAVSSFNSRYAGKIHQSMYPKGALCYTVSIPAMRVRYIPFLLYSFSCIHRFNSRYAGKIHPDISMDPVTAYEASFNSRYAGKIHLFCLPSYTQIIQFQFPLCG